MLLGIFDIFRKPTKKEITHDRMRKIRESGKDGERHFEQDNAFSEIKRVHHGADYVKPVRDSAGRIRKEPHEVKRNNSPLSKLQKKTHGLKVDRYIDTQYGTVKKTYNRNGDELKQDTFTGKWKKVRKWDSSGFGSLLGSNSSSKRKTSSGIDSFFGSGGSSSSRRKSSSGYDSMFGLGGSSSSRKKNNSSGFDSMFGTGSSKKRRSSSSWGF